MDRGLYRRDHLIIFDKRVFPSLTDNGLLRLGRIRSSIWTGSKVASTSCLLSFMSKYMDTLCCPWRSDFVRPGLIAHRRGTREEAQALLDR